MSNPFSFGTGALSSADRYGRLGFSRNPFVPMDDDDADGPFYDDHLKDQLEAINSWAKSCLEGNTQPLAIKGTIGAGKTRVIKALRKALHDVRNDQRICIEHVFLNRAGYARPNIAGFVLNALESLDPVWVGGLESCPKPVMPFVWALALSEVPAEGNCLVGKYVGRLQSSMAKAHDAEVLSRWLRRDSISSSQGRNLGLVGRIDAEGQQVHVLADLLKVGASVGVLSKLFLFIDQLEDLMRPSYSELRKSRMLEDIRSLMDYVGSGSPIGLLLSWSPEIDYRDYPGFEPDVDEMLEARYPAFYSRARRNVVQLELLTLRDAIKFAKVYSDRAVLAKKNPDVTDIALAAWRRLGTEGLLSGDSATPRDFLTALAKEVDSRL